MEAERHTTKNGVIVANKSLRSIPANSWPEWDLSYVEKKRLHDAGCTEQKIKKGPSRLGSAPC